MPEEVEVAPKRPVGRPKKVNAQLQGDDLTPPAIVLTPEEAARQEWHQFQAKATAYAEEQMAAPCPKCGARAGYNEVTGIQVRSHIGRTVVDGHRDSCPDNTANKKK